MRKFLILFFLLTATCRGNSINTQQAQAMLGLKNAVVQFLKIVEQAENIEGMPVELKKKYREEKKNLIQDYNNLVEAYIKLFKTMERIQQIHPVEKTLKIKE